jgi:hypothetical protein
MRSLLALVFLSLFLPTLVLADVPPLNLSFAEIAYTGNEPVTVMVLPDGTGTPLTAARLPWGEATDATITIYVRDQNNTPVPLFPREDMWLDTADGGLVFCQAGTIADANTDSEGTSTWTNPLFGGGSSQVGCRVLINGEVLANPPSFPLWFNSPDLNGDQAADLLDVVLFTGDFFGSYAHRSDFECDGRIDLLDLVALAQAMGSQCP